MTATPATRPLRTGGAVAAATVIEATPEAVWPVLFDRARWQAGYAGKTLLGGAESDVGERALHRSVDGERLEEILVLEPPRRCLMRLAAPDDGDTWAFASWRLTDEAVGCRLEFEVCWIESIPEAEADADAWRRRIDAGTRRALEAHLARIRAAVESPATS